MKELIMAVVFLLYCWNNKYSDSCSMNDERLYCSMNNTMFILRDNIRLSSEKRKFLPMREKDEK